MIRKEKMEQAKALLPKNLGKTPSEHNLWEQIHALELNEEELVALCQWIAGMLLETKKVADMIENLK